MSVIKHIATWIGIIVGLVFTLMVGIVVVATFNQWNDNRPAYVSPAIQSAIAAKTVIAGMTPAQVEQAWGKPDRAVTGFYNTVEVTQWFYKNRYVAFRDGVAVTATAPDVGAKP